MRIPVRETVPASLRCGGRGAVRVVNAVLGLTVRRVGRGRGDDAARLGLVVLVVRRVVVVVVRVVVVRLPGRRGVVPGVRRAVPLVVTPRPVALRHRVIIHRLR